MLSHELLEIWQLTYFIYSSSRYLALFLLFPIFRCNRSYFAISSFIHSTMESNSTRPNWCFYSCLKEGFLPEEINTANSAASPGHLGFLRFFTVTLFNSAWTARKLRPDKCFSPGLPRELSLNYLHLKDATLCWDVEVGFSIFAWFCVSVLLSTSKVQLPNTNRISLCLRSTHWKGWDRQFVPPAPIVCFLSSFFFFFAGRGAREVAVIFF